MTFKRRRSDLAGQASARSCNNACPAHSLAEADAFCTSQDAAYGSATQLQSVAPTQAGDAATLPPLPAYPPRSQEQQQQQPWGLQQQAEFFKQLDEEPLLETTSRQTTPAASRAASPGGPCTAPQPDLAAVITQQLGAWGQQHTPCSEEIQRHYPHVQASWGGGWDGGYTAGLGASSPARNTPAPIPTPKIRTPSLTSNCRRSSTSSTGGAWASSS